MSSGNQVPGIVDVIAAINCSFSTEKLSTMMRVFVSGGSVNESSTTLWVEKKNNNTQEFHPYQVWVESLCAFEYSTAK